jgi:iron(III) transport system ATP-binding protein
MASLDIERVSKSYGSYLALDALSLHVDPGEVMVLLGASGCGKTSLLRMIGGFLQPDSGSIRIDGELVASERVMVPPERRLLSMVFQSYAVWPHKTVFENLAYGLRLKRMADATMRAKVAQALAMVRMDGTAARYPAELSGGQQQRVALARALVLEPRLLLFDEPLSNLDASLREHMRFEIKAMLKELGITGIYVTHDQDEAMVLGDRIAVMAHGRIEQIGTPEQIYHGSRTAFVAGFVGLANVFDAEIVGVGGDGMLRLDVAGLGEMRARPDGAAQGRGQVFIRPESIRFGAAGAGDNILAGRVLRRTFLGASTDFLIDVAGTQLRVIVHSDDPDQPVAGAVSLRIRADRCLFLSA